MKKNLIILSLFLSSCSSSVKSNSSDNKHSIRCENNTSDCYSKASDLCPNGYLVTNRVRPVREGDDVVYTLNVKCRNGGLFK